MDYDCENCQRLQAELDYAQDTIEELEEKIEQIVEIIES